MCVAYNLDFIFLFKNKNKFILIFIFFLKPNFTFLMSDLSSSEDNSFILDINIRVGEPRTVCRALISISKPENQNFNIEAESLPLLIQRIVILVRNSVLLVN